MAIFSSFFSGDILNYLVALLALAALCSPKPSLTGILLLLEILVLAVIFSAQNEVWSFRFMASTFLGLFALVLTVANLYIEKSGTKPHAKVPRMNIFLGVSLLSAFYFYHQQLDLPKATSTHDATNQLFGDAFSIAIVIFALLSILFASLLIIDLKNHNE